MGRYLHAHLNRVFGNGAEEEPEPEETPTKRSRKPEPAPIKPPTQLESARAALTKAEETVVNIQRQLRELDQHRDSLPPVLSTGPVGERLARDAELAQIAASRTTLNRELGEAQAFLGRRQSELRSAFDRATEAARRVAYHEGRLMPLKAQEPLMREQLTKLQTLISDDFRQVVGTHYTGVLLNAVGALQTILGHQIPQLQSEFDTAIAEAERIGAPNE